MNLGLQEVLALIGQKELKILELEIQVRSLQNELVKLNLRPSSGDEQEVGSGSRESGKLENEGGTDN